MSTSPSPSRSASQDAGQGPQFASSTTKSSVPTLPLISKSPRQVSDSPDAVNVLLIEQKSSDVSEKFSA